MHVRHGGDRVHPWALCYPRGAEVVVAVRLSRPRRMWQLHVTGRLDILPDSTRHALKLAEEVTRDREAAFHCTIAIGYDGPEEIVNAVRSLLEGRRVPATASTTSASCCGG
jgi:undecaprenyl diphosphate synthase